jgi:putative methyltransferase (TIGR04325 family)
MPHYFFQKIQNYKLRKIWNGHFSNWSDAIIKTTSYDSDIILNKCKISLLKVKNGEAIYERDSVIFDSIDYSFGLLSGLLLSYINTNKLSVLDFGGSLGSSFYQNKNLLYNIQNIEWSVVEQQKFVECGKKNFENNVLKFYYTLEECFEYRKPNVLLLSSVLQYLENPYEFISNLSSYDFEYIIIDNTSFTDTDYEFITIQNVPEYIYKASYPCWFLNCKKLINSFKNYTLIAEFENLFNKPIYLKNNTLHWKGFILKKNKF